MESYWIITLTVYPDELARLALLAAAMGVLVWRLWRARRKPR